MITLECTICNGLLFSLNKFFPSKVQPIKSEGSSELLKRVVVLFAGSYCCCCFGLFLKVSFNIGSPEKFRLTEELLPSYHL